MKRYIRSNYDCSNIIGVGRVDSSVRKYLNSMPDWVKQNVIKFTKQSFNRGPHSIIYTLVVDPMGSDADVRPLIMKASSISELRNQIAEYEATRYAENRYTDTGVKTLI